jgi:mannose-6-phosphate isomerase-like protein (cupin superfamily)
MPCKCFETRCRMMNVQDYIASGILQEYCLGLLTEEEKSIVEYNCRLYPEIKAELEACQAGLDHYAQQFSTPPDPTLKHTIWNLLENVNREESGLAALPVLNKFADRQNWLRMIKPLLPAKLEQDLLVKLIRDDGQITQVILWSKVDYPEEVHDDLQECFLILEGECECYVDDEVFRLSAGGYFEIPLHAAHSVKILSPQVLAVVQRCKV